MKVSEFKFDEHLLYKPEQGRILFKDQRMVMMSADSFGTLLKEIIDIGGVNMARVFMRRFGETAGRNDARTIKNTLSPDTDIDWLALGPRFIVGRVSSGRCRKRSISTGTPGNST